MDICLVINTENRGIVHQATETTVSSYHTCYKYCRNAFGRYGYHLADVMLVYESGSYL